MHKLLTALLPLLITFSAMAATSEEERASKKYEISFQAGVDYRLSPTQVAGMYFLNAKNLVGLKVGADREGKNERQTNVAIQYKYYVANSAYLAGEAFYLNTREETDTNLSLNIFKEKAYAEYTSLGAGIRAGNQWTWKHVTLGVDWIGVGQRFGTFKKESSNLGSLTYTFFNVIIGTSF